MKNYLFLGDTHGDLDFVDKAAYLAAEHDAEIIQVGDWGFVWPGAEKLEALSLSLKRAGEYHAKPPVQMRFIDGNHDWHPRLKELELEALFRPIPPGGGFEIAPNVIYHPRGAQMEDEDGTRFLFMGGAPSIDKWNRTEGRSWWPTETITERQHAYTLKATGPFHVLVTHDAPDYPPGFKPAGDYHFRQQSRRSMEMIRELIDHHKPALHVHGHWHHLYADRRGDTKIVGLDCNFASLSHATLLWSRG